jgi:hypothetical protein
MQVDVTCRYCHRRLLDPEDLNDDRLPGVEEEYLYDCKPCNSRQCFKPNGKCTHWQFTVGHYSLCFNPATQNFRILRLDPRIDKSLQDLKDSMKPLLQLDYLPHNLTPKTVTEARIKVLILFS